MPNGDMLDQLQRLLEDDATIPQTVTNALVLAAIRQVYKELKEVKIVVDGLKGMSLLNKETDEKNVKWPWIRDNAILPMFRTAITLALGWVFLKVTGVAP